MTDMISGTPDDLPPHIRYARDDPRSQQGQQQQGQPSMRMPMAAMPSGAGDTEHRPSKLKRDLRTQQDHDDGLPPKPEYWQQPPTHAPDDIELLYTNRSARNHEFWWRVWRAYQQLKDDQQYVVCGIPDKVKQDVRLNERDHLIRQLETFRDQHPEIKYDR